MLKPRELAGLSWPVAQLERWNLNGGLLGAASRIDRANGNQLTGHRPPALLLIQLRALPSAGRALFGRAAPHLLPGGRLKCLSVARIASRRGRRRADTTTEFAARAGRPGPRTWVVSCFERLSDVQRPASGSLSAE